VFNISVFYRTVNIIGLEEKRQITLVLCVSASGKVLAPQMIFKGKKDR